MLSAAKHLDARRDRPFASLRVTNEGTRQSLHEAKGTIEGTRQMLRCAQHDRVWQLRLMHMRADKSAVCAINRHLRLIGARCIGPTADRAWHEGRVNSWTTTFMV